MVAVAAFTCGVMTGAAVMAIAWRVVDRRRASLLASLELRVRKLERGYSA